MLSWWPLSAKHPGRVAPRPPPDIRVVAIGDIHGRRDLMLRLLRRIADAFTPLQDGRRTRLVFLGDYIDRGDDSAGVLEVLSRLRSEVGDAVTVLRGNHEEALLRFLSDPVGGQAWLEFGAAQTLASYGVTPPARPATRDELARVRDELVAAMGDHVGLLSELPTSVRFGDVLFTHAGVNPRDRGNLLDTRAMVWGHTECLTPIPVPGLLLVHGHYDAASPVEHPGRICVDTGAYYSGVLTAVRIDDVVSFVSVTTGDPRAP